MGRRWQVPPEPTISPPSPTSEDPPPTRTPTPHPPKRQGGTHHIDRRVSILGDSQARQKVSHLCFESGDAFRIC